MPVTFDPFVAALPFLPWLIVVAALYWIFQLFRRFRQTQSNLANFRAALEGLNRIEASDRRAGMTLEGVEDLRLIVAGSPESIRPWCQKLEDGVERIQLSDFGDRWFLLREPRQLLDESLLIERTYKPEDNHSVPGLLTAFGLLLTFMSIVLALRNVSIQQQVVTGIDGLINGLGTKFWASIAGLFFSLIYVLLDRGLSSRLGVVYDRVVKDIDDRFPVLTELQLQVELFREARRQSLSLSNISTELVNRFVEDFNANISGPLADNIADGFQAKLSPTMEKMAGTLESLEATIRAIEGQKKESITAELGKMLNALDDSLQNTLRAMGEQFRQSLTGSATEQFEQIAATLRSTTDSMSGMQSLLATLQVALQALIQNAEQSSREQAEEGTRQLRTMTEAMEKLLLRLDESSSSNINKINESMAALIVDVGGKMEDLSGKMSASMVNAMEHSSRAVNDAVRTTDEQSSAILAKLNSLLGNIEARADDFRQAGQSLVSAQTAFRQTLSGNDDAMKRLQDVSDKLRTAALSIAETSRQSKDTETLQATAAQRLQNATAASVEVFGRLDQLLDRQQKVLETLDDRLRKVMEEIGSGLESYTLSVKDNFENISRVGNELIPPITEAVQAQVEALQDTLAELTDVLQTSISDLKR
jgi:ABC-type transporter Mla subunit MlaD